MRSEGSDSPETPNRDDFTVIHGPADRGKANLIHIWQVEEVTESMGETSKMLSQEVSDERWLRWDGKEFTVTELETYPDK